MTHAKFVWHVITSSLHLRVGFCIHGLSWLTEDGVCEVFLYWASDLSDLFSIIVFFPYLFWSIQVKAVYVKNLPKNVTQEQLKKLFDHHGKITKVVLPPAKSGQERNRIGFVHFSERSSAMKALKNTEKYELDGDYFSRSSSKNYSFYPSPKWGWSLISIFWCLYIRSSFGVFSCKATSRSEVWRIK